MNATASVPGTFGYVPAAGTVLDAGVQTLTATFTPDDTANYSGSTATVTVAVAKATTSVSWPQPPGIVYGTPLGAAQLNATANVPGTFSYTPAAGVALPVGTHALTVTFAPADTANYAGQTAATSIAVSRAPLTIRANDAVKVFGAPLPVFSTTTTGLVNGDTVAVLGGGLSFVTTAAASSAVGGYPVTPQGVSASNYTIAFASGTLTVQRASTLTVVSSSANPSGANQGVTFSATVTPAAPGAGVPTGTVQFADGPIVLGTVVLVNGSAALNTNGMAAGTHAVSAIYSGSPSFTGGSAALTQTVKTASASSTTVVTSSANPSNVGQSITLTATVSTSSGDAAGTVQFYDGATLIGSATISGTTARLTTSTLALGGHAITARYLGSATKPPSTSAPFPQYVRPLGATTRTSTTALAASPSPVALGAEVALTATVTGSQNRAPTGRVIFMVNGFVVADVSTTTISSTKAVAVLRTSALARGTHTVTATYLGDLTYRASTAPLSLIVN